jgi:hypothetical protein
LSTRCEWRNEWLGVSPRSDRRAAQGYLRCEGLRSFEGYGAAAVPIAGGDDPTVLLKELAASMLTNSSVGDVALVVARDASNDPPAKERLMSINGKLVSVRCSLWREREGESGAVLRS